MKRKKKQIRWRQAIEKFDDFIDALKSRKENGITLFFLKKQDEKWESVGIVIFWNDCEKKSLSG